MHKNEVFAKGNIGEARKFKCIIFNGIGADIEVP